MLVEPLENRQLLAGDTFVGLLGSSYDDAESPTPGSGLVAEGELVGEGEAAPDLVAFAQALTDSGTRFFGAAWCPFCTEQKELFEDGYKNLPFIEVTNPDRTPNQIATDEGITEYPTWEFPDGTRLTGIQSLQTLSTRAGVTIPNSSTPSTDDLADVTVAIGSPLHIPIDAYDPNGNPLTITVTSSDNSLITAEVLSGNQSLRLNTAGFGDMVFELFETRASRPANRVIALANDGFYDGVSFHRVINNFVIQGGDPTGTGAGGSTLGDFDDQFHVDLQHNRTGVLSYAKSTDDTNDSQFFITEGQQRFLDFNHSIFGQLVEGEPVREAISNTSTNASDRPTNDVIIESATVFTDTENGVVVLRPTGSGTGSATITVTVSDTEGNSTSQTFQASVVQDTANGAPFLNDVATVETTVNTPVNVNLSAQDKEGDTRVFSVQALGSQSFGLSVDSSTGVVTVTPPTNFTGELQFRATVQQTTTPTTNSTDDNQIVTVQVNNPVPTGLDLATAFDSGSSSTDDNTNATALTFTVAGTTPGALVEIRAGGSVVGSATASGTSTDVVLSDVTGLGEGAILFTATQTSGGQTSGESPALGVTLDRSGPAALGAGIVPTSAIVDQTLSVDIDHGEEGQGLTYALSGAPTGMTIGASDGQLNWTPSSGQLGTQTLTLELTDTAGNTTNQQISINVIEEPLIRITLNAVDSAGQPITTVATGEEFKVQVIVEDMRPGTAGTGVFATYVDLLYDSNIIEPIATTPIEHIAPYQNDTSGSTATLGIVDELGAFSSSTARLGNDLRVLAEVTFVAKVAGNAGLTLESADDTGNDVLLYDEGAAVPESRVQFVNSTFAVGANFQPVNDAFNFDEDDPTQTLNVLSNDETSGSAVLSIADVSTPSGGGQATVASNGLSISYTPAANFSGAEVFTYTAQNQDGVQLDGTVTVQVTEVNDPPVALNDTFSVFRDSVNNVLEVLTNDSTGVDPSSAESLSVTDVSTGSEGGAISIGSSGLFINYSPRSGFQGTETFTYTVSDGRGGSETATVSVSVDLANPPPTPQNDSFTLNEDDDQASFDVLQNDTTDDPTETLSVADVGTSLQGSQISVSSDGLQVLYRPAANFNGTEIVTYTLRDSGGATADGLMTFTVAAVNDPPTAVNDSLTATSGDATTTLDVLANDTNVDSGETLQITDVTQPPSGSGTLAIASDGLSLIYTSPSSTFESTFTATYTLSDGNGLTDTATVTVDVQDFVPRDFIGSLNLGAQTSENILAGVRLQLSGTDITGNTVTTETVVNADGTYSFPNMAPGEYTITRPALPFLNDPGASISLSSASADGNAVNDLLVTGSLRPEFFDIRDFLGSTTSNSLTVAVNGDGSQNWTTGRGEWSTLSSLTVTVDTDANALRVAGVNSSAQNVEATLPLESGSSRAYQAGQESGFRLLRVRGSLDSVGLSASTGGAGEGEGESVAPQSLIAEGEATPQIAADNTPTLNAPAIVQVREGDTASDTPLSPTEALRRLLGSSTEARQAELASEAVDAAMESVLPKLEVQLSDSLQDSLTADTNESLEVNDKIVAGL